VFSLENFTLKKWDGSEDSPLSFASVCSKLKEITQTQIVPGKTPLSVTGLFKLSKCSVIKALDSKKKLRLLTRIQDLRRNNMIIDVTQKHINMGIACNPTCCMLAYALQDATGVDWSIAPEIQIFGEEKSDRWIARPTRAPEIYYLPPSVAKKACRHDFLKRGNKGPDIKPFSFWFSPATKHSAHKPVEDTLTEIVAEKRFYKENAFDTIGESIFDWRLAGKYMKRRKFKDIW
jgi:hypothetical protein